LRCYYTNSDSLINKRSELHAEIVKYAPDVICVTEVAPKSTIYPLQEAELQIKGYDLFSNIENHKRGVVIYIHRDLKASPSTVEELWESEEGCWCEVDLVKDDRLLIGCIYRSPNSDEANNEKMLSSIRRVCNEAKFSHLLLCGDFNIPEIDWIDEISLSGPNHLAFKFMENIRDCFWYQHVKNPTRSRRNQAENILDLVITNEEGMVDDIQYGAPLGKSDHLVLKFNFLCYKDIQASNTSKFSFNKGNYTELSLEMKKHKWKQDLTGLTVEESWNLFEKRLMDAMKHHIPKRRQKGREKLKPLWMTQKVLIKLKKKQTAFKRYLMTREGKDYQQYARTRNQTKWICQSAVKDFEKNLAREAKINPKAFFNYTNSKLKTTSSVPDLDVRKGVKTKGDKEKANLLNDFFSSVFTREDLANIPDFEERELIEKMGVLEVTEEMVLKKLKKLKPNKSAGLDLMSPRVLIEAAEAIVTPVTMLIQKTLSEGTLPQRWKDAAVTPIYKKGKKSTPGNYRPVSLTSVLCKLTEGIIRDHIMDHLYKNHLLTSCQHGFVRGRSCITQLLECLDEWTEILDLGGSIDVIYMDYAKAFDKVAHVRLLKKLEGYGVSKQVMKWIQDFLHGRRQKVTVNSEESNWADVLSGVPQGSVLGPVLFICYINDLPEQVKTKVKLFADDTKLYAKVSDEEGGQNLQDDINNLDRWAREWQLSFNSSKCKVMHIGHKNPHRSYNMIQEGHSVELEKTEREKDIGVNVDNELKFDRHIEIQCGKANRILGLIRRSFTYLDKHSMKQLYTALIRPILEYGHVITYPRYKKSAILLENVQHRATKMVPELKDLEYEDRLREMDLQSLYYRRDRGDMIECYKMTHGSYDIDPILKQDTDTTRRGNSFKLKMTSSSKEVRHHYFSIRVVSKWNSLPESVVDAPSLNSFKNRLDKHWNIHKISQVPLPPCKIAETDTLIEDEIETVVQA